MGLAGWLWGDLAKVWIRPGTGGVPNFKGSLPQPPKTLSGVYSRLPLARRERDKVPYEGWAPYL